MNIEIFSYAFLGWLAGKLKHSSVDQRNVRVVHAVITDESASVKRLFRKVVKKNTVKENTFIISVSLQKRDDDRQWVGR